MAKVNSPTAVDLFCGAGGLSLGFIRAGFSVICAVDSWQPAVRTYADNIGSHVRKEPITSSIELPPATVVTGGPPCQGFSSAGRRRDNDYRNSLVAVFAELVATRKPEAFVFENVEGFLTGARGRFVLELLEPVIDAGYRVHLRKVNAAHYGVPQHRKRVVAIGGLGWDPTFPEPSHSAFGAPGSRLANGSGLASTHTLAEALQALPPAIPRGMGASDADHQFTPLDGDDLRRAELLGPGQRMRDLPEELWHESYRRRANRRVKDGTPTEKRGGAPAGIRRLCGDEPSKAITGGALRDFLHPDENRPLTIRECAVLQTFPVDYKFSGTSAERIQQIGNAVPPRFAEHIAMTLALDLARVDKPRRPSGALLSFVPTLSVGMSPILKDVSRRVNNRFIENSKLKQLELWD